MARNFQDPDRSACTSGFGYQCSFGAEPAGNKEISGTVEAEPEDYLTKTAKIWRE